LFDHPDILIFDYEDQDEEREPDQTYLTLKAVEKLIKILEEDSLELSKKDLENQIAILEEQTLTIGLKPNCLSEEKV
jgi:hypothetical protein